MVTFIVIPTMVSKINQSQVIDKVKPQFLTPLLQYLLTDLVFRFVCHFLSICKKQGRNFASLAYQMINLSLLRKMLQKLPKEW